MLTNACIGIVAHTHHSQPKWSRAMRRRKKWKWNEIRINHHVNILTHVIQVCKAIVLCCELWAVCRISTNVCDDIEIVFKQHQTWWRKHCAHSYTRWHRQKWHFLFSIYFSTGWTRTFWILVVSVAAVADANPAAEAIVDNDDTIFTTMWRVYRERDKPIFTFDSREIRLHCIKYSSNIPCHFSCMHIQACVRAIFA